MLYTKTTLLNLSISAGFGRLSSNTTKVKRPISSNLLLELQVFLSKDLDFSWVEMELRNLQFRRKMAQVYQHLIHGRNRFFYLLNFSFNKLDLP